MLFRIRATQAVGMPSPSGQYRTRESLPVSSKVESASASAASPPGLAMFLAIPKAPRLQAVRFRHQPSNSDRLMPPVDQPFMRSSRKPPRGRSGVFDPNLHALHQALSEQHV